MLKTNHTCTVSNLTQANSSNVVPLAPMATHSHRSPPPSLLNGAAHVHTQKLKITITQFPN